MSKQVYSWAVIGAGPAGIAAVGKLIDFGINPKELLWIDPYFSVGDFGKCWSKVSSNTPTYLFLKFLNECSSFGYHPLLNFEIEKLEQQNTCLIKNMVEPLQWITNHLKTKVNFLIGNALHLRLKNNCWSIKTDGGQIEAKKIILAIGAESKSLSYPGIKEINLSTALDPDALMKECRAEDTIALFGSSHSAIVILKTLIEKCQLNRIYNFYRSPIKYAVNLKDSILFDYTGLKGISAQWAKEKIDGILPINLQRIISNEYNQKIYLPQCNKVIYATGFHKRLISVDGIDNLNYNPYNGIIAPGLFGIGIAFPQLKIDQFGNGEYAVGLWPFMEYIDNILHVWSNYHA